MLEKCLLRLGICPPPPKQPELVPPKPSPEGVPEETHWCSSSPSRISSHRLKRILPTSSTTFVPRRISSAVTALRTTNTIEGSLRRSKALLARRGMEGCDNRISLGFGLLSEEEGQAKGLECQQGGREVRLAMGEGGGRRTGSS